MTREPMHAVGLKRLAIACLASEMEELMCLRRDLRRAKTDDGASRVIGRIEYELFKWFEGFGPEFVDHALDISEEMQAEKLFAMARGQLSHQHRANFRALMEAGAK